MDASIEGFVKALGGGVGAVGDSEPIPFFLL